jgi:hypothetical protein
MLLRLYSSNQPFLFATIPVLAWLGVWPLAHAEVPALIEAGYPAELWFDFFTNRPAFLAMATWVLISIGAWFSILVFNRHEFYPSPVYLPGLLYTGLAVGLCLRGISLPALAGNIFLLAGLDQLLRVYHQQRALAEYFGCGLLFGCAFLLFPPFVIAGFGLWIAILYTRPFHWREYVIALLAFLTPAIWWISLRYTNGNDSPIVFFTRYAAIDRMARFYQSGLWDRLIWITITVSLVFALPRVLFPKGRVTNKARNLIHVFVIITLSLAGSFTLDVFLNGSWNAQLLLVPLTFVLGVWFANYRFSLLAPLFFYAWLVTILLRVMDFARWI